MSEHECYAAPSNKRSHFSHWNDVSPKTSLMFQSSEPPFKRAASQSFPSLQTMGVGHHPSAKQKPESFRRLSPHDRLPMTSASMHCHLEEELKMSKPQLISSKGLRHEVAEESVAGVSPRTVCEHVDSFVLQGESASFGSQNIVDQFQGISLTENHDELPASAHKDSEVVRPVHACEPSIDWMRIAQQHFARLALNDKSAATRGSDDPGLLEECGIRQRETLKAGEATAACKVSTLSISVKTATCDLEDDSWGWYKDIFY